MSHVQTQPREIADAQIRVMLEAFAGPAAPVRTAVRTRRRGTRRTVLLLVAALVVVGLAVPGALALLGKWETPKQFVADKSQPAYMREVIGQWMNAVEAGGWAVPPPGGYERVTAVKTVLTAKTPDGQARVYAFRFTHGKRAILASLTREARFLAGSGAEVGVPEATPARCGPGCALQVLDGRTERIGRTVGYVLGRVSPRVASVRVLYRNGSTTQGAVGNGYFLAWMNPSAGRTNVTLIAENATGQTIARLVIDGSGFLFAKSLVGTWTRTLTAADLRRENTADFTAGRLWRLVIAKNGTASYGEVGQPQDPNMRGPIVLAGPHRLHVYNRFTFPNVYRWAVSGRSLTLTKIQDWLPRRAAILVGTWKRR